MRVVAPPSSGGRRAGTYPAHLYTKNKAAISGLYPIP